MNIQHLRYFIAVAEAGSITAAAEEMRMSQPSLSRQIRAFEDDLGVTLLERGARSIHLTSKGKAVLEEGKKMMKRLDAGILNIRRAVENEVIIVGYAPSLGGELLQKAISQFSQCHSQINVELHDLSAEEMQAGLLDGSLDLCIDAPNKNTALNWELLLQRPLALAVPKSHPLLSKKPNRRVIPVEELRDERFLFFSRHEYPAAWENMTNYFMKSGVNVKVAGEFDGIVSLSLAIESGLGLALITKNSRMSDEVKLLTLKPTPDPVCVAVGWSAHKALDPVRLEFVNELKRAANS